MTTSERGGKRGGKHPARKRRTATFYDLEISEGYVRQRRLGKDVGRKIPQRPPGLCLPADPSPDDGDDYLGFGDGDNLLEFVQEQEEGGPPLEALNTRGAKRYALRYHWKEVLQHYLDDFTQACTPRAKTRRCAERRCGVPVVRTTITVLDLARPSLVDVTSCREHLVPTLLSLRLFPSSPSAPQHAITFDLAVHYRHLVLAGGISTQALGQALALTYEDAHHDLRTPPPTPCSNSTFLETLVWHSRFVAAREERLRRLAWGCDSDGLARLALKCPLCFGGLRNRSTEARPSSAPTAPAPCLPDLFVSIDGNFQHKRRARVDVEADYGREWQLFVDDERINAMRRHLDQNPLKPSAPPAACDSQFAAADNTTKAATGFFDVTGLMLMVCRHDIPLFACDIDTPGERYEYALALIEALMEAVGEYVDEVGVIYDIACRIGHSVQARNLLPKWKDKIVWAVPVWHAYAHTVQCQLQYSTRRLTGFGLTDGEGTERAWSALAPLVSAERNMGKHRRREALEGRMAHVASQKLPLAFERIAARARRTLDLASTAFAKVDRWRYLSTQADWKEAARTAKEQFDHDAAPRERRWLPWLVSAAGDDAEHHGDTGPVLALMMGHITAPLSSRGPASNEWEDIPDNRTALLEAMLPLVHRRTMDRLARRTMTVNRSKAYLRLLEIEKEQSALGAPPLDGPSLYLHTKKSGELRAEKLTILKAHHTLQDHGSASRSLHVLCALALGELDRVRQLVVIKRLEEQRLERPASRLGTNAVQNIKGQIHTKAKQIRSTVKLFNEIIANLRPGPATAYPLLGLDLPKNPTLKDVEERMELWEQLDDTPHRQASRSAPLWDTDSQLSECLDAHQELCRVVEEFCLMDREVRSALSWATEATSHWTAAIQGAENQAEKWLCRRELSRLLRHHQRWREALRSMSAWASQLPWLQRRTGKDIWVAADSLMAMACAPQAGHADLAATMRAWSESPRKAGRARGTGPVLTGATHVTGAVSAGAPREDDEDSPWSSEAESEDEVPFDAALSKLKLH